MRGHLHLPTLVLVTALTASACDRPGTEPTAPDVSGTITTPQSTRGTGDGGVESALASITQQVNAALTEAGANHRLGMIETLTAQDEQGRTVFFRDVGNKQLAFDFVPGDPRRAEWSGPVGPGDDVTWASDQTAEGDAGPGLAATQAAIASAVALWADPTCSTLPLTDVSVAGDLGVLQFILPNLINPAIPPGSFGGSPDVAADVTHGGFGTIVDLLLPAPTIAATFTFIFVDGDGDPTDIDNDGKLDAAFREIYYTFNFPWAIDDNIDVETVAAHEFGHGISQAHFGTLFRTDRNGRFHFAPRALMNAGYTGIQQLLSATDVAGHCSNWSQWPNN